MHGYGLQALEPMGGVMLGYERKCGNGKIADEVEKGAVVLT